MCRINMLTLPQHVLSLHLKVYRKFVGSYTYTYDDVTTHVRLTHSVGSPITKYNQYEHQVDNMEKKVNEKV